MNTEILSKIKADLVKALKKVKTMASYYAVKSLYLTGKNSIISELMRSMGKMLPEERKSFGLLVNPFKNEINALFEQKEREVFEMEIAARNEKERLDVSMPSTCQKQGAIHPVSLIVNQMQDIFCSMGFSVYEGIEIEDDYHNFTALNVPPEHPARDKQDTFYVADGLLLRTHTSPGQIRVMQEQELPIKVVVPGKVFRCDDDATHTPMFHQMEGLVVDKGITLCDLQGMLTALAQRIFSADTKTRLRPSYFPFTEPSVEIDVSCCNCNGKGCSLCKGTGWLEILGGGVVNRRVLVNCGIDPDKYSAIAFGVGLERIAMLKYGINNIKLLFENDLNILKQFRTEV